MKMHSNMSMVMQMFFTTKTDVYVLFEEWYVQSVGEMVAAVIGVFIFAMLNEGLKVLREYVNYFVKSLNLNIIKPKSTIEGEDRNKYEPLLSENLPPINNSKANRQVNELIGHFVLTLLQTIQYIIGYLLMLIAMTFNLWLFLAVVLGMGTGYFVFAWMKKKIPSSSNEIISASQDACDCLS